MYRYEIIVKRHQKHYKLYVLAIVLLDSVNKKKLINKRVKKNVIEYVMLYAIFNILMIQEKNVKISSPRKKHFSLMCLISERLSKKIQVILQNIVTTYFLRLY